MSLLCDLACDADLVCCGNLDCNAAHAPDVAAVQFTEGEGGAISGGLALLGGAHAQSQAALFAALTHAASAILLEVRRLSLPSAYCMLFHHVCMHTLFGACRFACTTR